VGGFEGSWNAAGQVVAHRVQVYRVLEAHGERGHGLFGVVIRLTATTYR
jgi:hypothetical protein